MIPQALPTSEATASVAIDALDQGTILLVRTRKSTYSIVVLDARHHKVLVQGGRLLPEAAEGAVQGASAGGSCLKVGWIAVGLRLELVVDRQRIVTSRVESIRIAPMAA